MKRFAVVVMALLGLIVVLLVLPMFNVVVHDTMCLTGGCSGEKCVSYMQNRGGTCEFKLEYYCLEGCEARKFSCGFDPVFKENCLTCLDKCEDSFNENNSINRTIRSNFKECIRSCSDYERVS